MSPKRIALTIIGALVLGFIVFNFENWLEGHGWNNIFTDFEQTVKKMDFSLTGIWDAINAFMISDFAIGLLIGGLIFTFWDPIARYGKSLFGVGQSGQVEAETALVYEQRMAGKEGRVSRESEEKKLQRKAQIAVDDLKAEAVAYRNELIPALENYGHDAEWGKLKDWNDRVLQKLDEAGVPVSARSRVRTLNLFQAVYHDEEGKDGRQSKLESIWNEKINRLQKIIDNFD